jgi:hypothetical protein
MSQLFGEPLVTENLRVHPIYQYFLVIGAIEDAYPSSFGKAAGGAPQKIMF